MNEQILINAGIDYDGGVKRFMGRSQLYMKTLSKFPKDSTMERVRADHQRRDRDALLRDAHELKGMCGNMSMPKLFGAADAIVKLLRSGDMSEENLNAAINALKTEYAIVREAVLAAEEASK